MSQITSDRFYLTKPTFICLTDNTLVFLDLHHDSYSCLESKHTRFVARLLGLPVPSVQNPQSGDASCGAQGLLCEDASIIVRDLLDRGLITQDANEGKQAKFISQSGELRELLGYEIGEAPKIGVGHVLNFFKALIITKSMLRFASMERIITRVARRKQEYSQKPGVSEKPDLARINELTEIYKILKPLFVTVRDNCLFNSFFLIEFLAHYHIYPTWYFGVRLNEFYAHCWVQEGNVIYDDHIHITCQNQPIMMA